MPKISLSFWVKAKWDVVSIIYPKWLSSKCLMNMIPVRPRAKPCTLPWSIWLRPLLALCSQCGFWVIRSPPLSQFSFYLTCVFSLSCWASSPLSSFISLCSYVGLPMGSFNQDQVISSHPLAFNTIYMMLTPNFSTQSESLWDPEYKPVVHENLYWDVKKSPWI